MKQLILISWISLLFFHTLGVFRGFYDSIGFYDMVLHFLGGALVSLTILIFLKNIFLKNTALFHLVFAFTATITIRASWEFFEMLLDIFLTPNFSFPIPRQNLLDTLSDLLLDGAGSISLIIVYLIHNAFRKH